jgi:hypothetical protein
MDLTYQQVLAEVFDENAKNTLVFQQEFENDEVEEYTTNQHENNELDEPELFNKFQGNRGKPEHVIKPEAVDHRLSSVKHATRFRTNVINIDGKFRSLVTTVNTLSPEISNSANFVFRPARQYINVSSIKVSSFEFLNNFYTFTKDRGNTTFTIGPTGVENTITIPDGNYDRTTIQTVINAYLTSYPWKLRYISNFNKFQFYDSSVTPSPFGIIFPSTSHPTGNGIGYNLGFQKNIYNDISTSGIFLDNNGSLLNIGNNINAIQSDNSPDLIQDTYVFLKLQDWNVVEHHTSNQTSFQAFMKIPLNAAKNTVIFDNDSTNTITKTYTPQQPINVNSITITLVDAWGVTLKLLNSTFSITLEIKEVLDSQTYEKLLELNE